MRGYGIRLAGDMKKTIRSNSMLNIKTIKKVLELIWQEFIYGGHLQSLGTVAIILVPVILLNIKITWDILFISFFLFYPIYLYNRWKELNIDRLTNPQRTEHLETYIKKAPIILLLVILLLIGSLFYFSNFRFTVFALLVLFFGLLYTVFFKKLTKKIFAFKNFYVAIFFTLVVIFPVIYYNYPLTEVLIRGLLAFMIFVFLKTIMMQIFLDLKDLDGDKKEGILTFPVIFGKEKTLKFLKSFSVFATVLPVFPALYLKIFPLSANLLLLTILFDFHCFRLAKEDKYSGYLLMSGMFIFWAILILTGKIIL